MYAGGVKIKIKSKMQKAKTDTGIDTPRRFEIATLGCKVNAFESELIAQKLLQQGYRRRESAADSQVDSPADFQSEFQPDAALHAIAPAADVCVINTCTVTAEADRQARQLVRRMARNNPHAVVVVTGCYAQMDAAACAAIPGVDVVVGNSQKLDIPALLESHAKPAGMPIPPIPPIPPISPIPSPNPPNSSPNLRNPPISPPNPPSNPSNPPSLTSPPGPAAPMVLVDDVAANMRLPGQLISGFADRARAFLQIQQGCDQGCTFCVIHKARGPNRSLKSGIILRQARQFIDNGHGELVICGVDIGSYGADLGGENSAAETENLSALLRRLSALPGDFRIRLSSLDPAHITDPLIALLAESPRFCPHLHLSLQSASTLILKRMKRRASREMVYERIGKLRQALPNLVLSADLLVGFPTESMAHFQHTLDAVDELEIAYPHVFAYSPRAGTPAAKIPAQVALGERKRRAAAARRLGAQVWRRVAARLIGARLRVLVEKRDNLPPGVAFGRCANYFPVHFSGAARSPGQWAEVRINAVRDAVLAGEAWPD